MKQEFEYKTDFLEMTFSFLNVYYVLVISLLNKDLILIIKEETNKCKRITIIP